MSLTWESVRRGLDIIAEQQDNWQGIPAPHPDFALRLCKGHPMAEAFGPQPPDPGLNLDRLKIRNTFYVPMRNVRVWIFEEDGVPGIQHVIEPCAPDRSMDRLNMWLDTIGASYVWGLEPELRAREKLRSMIPPHLYQMYELTGSFLEYSERSRVHYMFRRNRPTVAMIPTDRNNDTEPMKVLAVLCMHPIGYYQSTWAGCMVPTDDVVAHLTMMRGDEKMYWRKCNQHEPASPEAGL